MGSEPRTELEQATGESHSTSTPPPPAMYSFLRTKVDPYHPSIGSIHGLLSHDHSLLGNYFVSELGIQYLKTMQ